MMFVWRLSLSGQGLDEPPHFFQYCARERGNFWTLPTLPEAQHPLATLHPVYYLLRPHSACFTWYVMGNQQLADISDYRWPMKMRSSPI
jgi:hypothetical protein